jgi:hypothetical protein
LCRWENKNVKLVGILNHISYVVVALSHIACGYAVADFGHRFSHAYHIVFRHGTAVTGYEDLPMPGGYLLVLPYVNSSAPIAVGYVVGLVTLGLLLFLEREGERTRAWIPTTLAIGLLLGFLPLIFIAWAMSLPLSYG